MHTWTNLARHVTVDAYVKFRAEMFCCSAVYGTKSMAESAARAQHVTPLYDRRVEKEHACPVLWKVRACPAASLWIVLGNDLPHLRGDLVCEIPPRPVITSAIRAYILREEEKQTAPKNIWSSLFRAPDLPAPVLGFSTYAQVARCVKYLRWQHGTKNSILHVQELVRENVLSDETDIGTGFVFGYRDDDEGFPHVTNGFDSDPLILGISSMALLCNILVLQSREDFHLFHLDATFKLCDIGYPVITCGFTDRSRRYHLAAMFIVSRRTANEYRLAVGSFTRLFEKTMNEPLKIDAVMSDAEDAQLLGLQSLARFDGATYLMCFFHVLFNARKRLKHLQEADRASVLRVLLDLHFTRSQVEFDHLWDRATTAWRSDTRFSAFMVYFHKEWIRGRFTRWQIFHSPSGCATTNNPCEVFNASIKRYTQRKALDIGRLIKKLLVIAEDTSICAPPLPSLAASRLPPPPREEAKRLAKVLTTTNRVSIYSTEDDAVLLVRYLADGREERDEEPLPPGMRVVRSRSNGTCALTITDGEKKSATAFYRAAMCGALTILVCLGKDGVSTSTLVPASATTLSSLQRVLMSSAHE